MIDRPTPAGLERSIARVLTIGTMLSIALLAIGFVLLLAAGLGPRSSDSGFDPGRLAGDLAAFKPDGFIWLGLLVVVAMPAARVAAALLGYIRRGERDMAIVGVLILAVIAASVVIARVVEG